MKLKKIIVLMFEIAILMFIAACTEEKAVPAPVPCVDVNYSDDHAVNVARCLQSLEDGSAYEIDEALTVQAPWRVGDVVAKFRDGEGGYILREFKGVTKAGYYLVQDYETGYVGRDWPPYKSGEYPSYDAEKITNEKKKTDPFALMNLCAVKKTSSLSTLFGMPSVCGPYTSYKYNNYYKNSELVKYYSIKEQGAFLDGVKDGEWAEYYSKGKLESKITYANGILNGVFLRNNYGINKLRVFSYYDNGQSIFGVIFNEDGQAKEIKIREADQDSAFAEFNEDDQTIRHGYWKNGVKVGLWRTWDTQGVLLEEIDYDLQP